MRVTACSIFRDSVGYVDRYLSQMALLAEQVDLRLVLTFGDCTDGTGQVLVGLGAKYDLLDRMDVERFDHGGPNFGSVDNPQRWDQISRVVRHTLGRVGDPGDALLWVESDLCWEVDSMAALLDDLQAVPAVAPRVLADTGKRWYDIWGYRKDGRLFNAYPPYLPDGSDLGCEFVKIDSCGSCWAAKDGVWRDWSGHWPFPADGQLWLDPTVTVRHP